ncbi:hypothetical protein VTN02DRAFT_5642 [Thermoascus thermophilus]
MSITLLTFNPIVVTFYSAQVRLDSPEQLTNRGTTRHLLVPATSSRIVWRYSSMTTALGTLARLCGH